MENIKFIGRKEELKLINNIKNNFFLIIRGRRRIGKTMLLTKAFPKAYYLFIWPDKSLNWVIKEICKENSLPEFINFKDLLNHLLDKGIVIIDEFQNFVNIDKSVYGEIQKIIDERKIKNKNFKLAVAGSSNSLMNKVFNDSASPLYGRRTYEIHLKNLEIVDLYNELNISLDSFFKLWSVFEGVPYYYELINQNLLPEKNIFNLIVSKNAQLQNEGKAILSIEFGKDSKTYNTILSDISYGKTRLNELAGSFNNKTNEVIKYLETLRTEFNLVIRETPILENPKKSRISKYKISDNFLSFWFIFIDKQRNLIEQDRFIEVEDYFNKNFNLYLGRKLEDFIILLFKSNIINIINFNKIGKQWGRFKGTEGKNTYEIDIVATNDKDILFCECKYKDNVDAEKIYNELKEKSKLVNWNNEQRKEHYAIFAKSFNKKIKKENLKLYDLKDIEKCLK